MGRGGWGPRGGMDRMPPGGGFRDRRNWRDRYHYCNFSFPTELISLSGVIYI